MSAVCPHLEHSNSWVKSMLGAMSTYKFLRNFESLAGIPVTKFAIAKGESIPLTETMKALSWSVRVLESKFFLLFFGCLIR